MSWTQLSYPFAERSRALLINTNEFVVLSKAQALDNIGIHKFDMETNEWSEIYAFDDTKYGSSGADKKYLNVWRTSWTTNTDTQMIYDCDNAVSFTFNLNNKTLKEIIPSINLYTDSILCIDSMLHIIQSPYGTLAKHMICDGNMSDYQTIHEFKELGIRYEGYGFVHLKSKGVILLVGGWNSSSAAFDAIYECCIATNQWTKLDVKLPKNLSHFGIVSTENDEYILMIAGWIDGCDASQDVFILDVDQCEVTLSKAVCPAGGYCSAVITGDPMRDELLTFGYVKNCFKTKPFAKVGYFPNELVLIIRGYMCRLEEIHAIIGAAHYKIDVSDVICHKVIP